MSVERKRRCRWFWPWQDGEESAWLEDMSRRGWHLASYGFLVYTFVRGEPRDYIYRLDLAPPGRTRREDYLRLFRDAGWEHVASWGGWKYFRAQPGTTMSTEIYTDDASRAARYRRVLLVLVIIPLLTLRSLLTRPAEGALLQAVRAFAFVLLVVSLYAVLRLLVHIGRFRRRGSI